MWQSKERTQPESEQKTEEEIKGEAEERRCGRHSGEENFELMTFVIRTLCD